MHIKIFNKVTLFSYSANSDTKFFNILGIKIKTKKNKLSNKQLKKLNYKYEKGLENTPKVKNRYQTLEELIITNKSITRYGDGEFFLILGKSIPFQNYNELLSQRLAEILKNQNENILVCVPDIFGKLNQYTKNEAFAWRKFITKYRDSIYSILDFNKQYFDSIVSRPYMGIADKTQTKEYFNRIKKIWHNKSVVFVEGEGSRLGYNNDLFSNAASIKRIVCPSKNAFEKYDEILRECKNFSKDCLFILALGPTATVLAFDLQSLGYRALDLGHIDIEYEWFLRKATKKIPIKDKCVNEAKNGKTIIISNDYKYITEIVADYSK